MNQTNKELKQAYLATPPAMGVFLIRNMINGRTLVCQGKNLQGRINRSLFELEKGKHKNRELQDEWNAFGSENFAFEIVDVLEPSKETPANDAADLAALAALWLEKLQPFGERGYNERPLSREEMLREIAARRGTDD
ncbi:MAG TPA: GIY-YIG nuclease family protein [Pyrinomonadaceae bacterium]